MLHLDLTEWMLIKCGNLGWTPSSDNNVFLPCFFLFYFFDSHRDRVQEGFAECPGPN